MIPIFVPSMQIATGFVLVLVFSPNFCVFSQDESKNSFIDFWDNSKHIKQFHISNYISSHRYPRPQARIPLLFSSDRTGRPSIPQPVTRRRAARNDVPFLSPNFVGMTLKMVWFLTGNHGFWSLVARLDRYLNFFRHKSWWLGTGYLSVCFVSLYAHGKYAE